jgi:glutamyl/glutaminyl-tRNA synthetase
VFDQGLRTRIAPTPSGYLHEGNVLSFLATAMLAEEHQGHLLLRIDDLDAERQRPEYVEDIFRTLSALGITWDAGPRDATDFSANWSQQLRLPRYFELLKQLKDQGCLYACSCSRTERAACTCASKDLSFDAPDHVWRLKIPPATTVRMKCWPDGTERVHHLSEQIQDPVLRQRNGRPAYQMASLADDVDHRINVIVRGEDLLPSTCCQLYLAERLGLPAFNDVLFLHHRLITDATGVKLSKSHGARPAHTFLHDASAIAALRERARELLRAIS